MFSKKFFIIFITIICNFIPVQAVLLNVTQGNQADQNKMKSLAEHKRSGQDPVKSRRLFNSKFKQFSNFLDRDNDTVLWGRVLQALKKVDKNKLQKEKRLRKFIYPLLMGVLITKVILVPLMLKILTILSTSAFVVSKVALAASGLLALKWLLMDPASGNTERVEVPYRAPNAPYRYASGNIYMDDDQVLSVNHQPQYIPLYTQDTQNSKLSENALFL